MKFFVNLCSCFRRSNNRGDGKSNLSETDNFNEKLSNMSKLSDVQIRFHQNRHTAQCSSIDSSQHQFLAKSPLSCKQSGSVSAASINSSSTRQIPSIHTVEMYPSTSPNPVGVATCPHRKRGSANSKKLSASSVEDNFCGTCRKCTANARGIATNKAHQNESSLLNSTNYDGLCTSGYSIVDDDCCSSLVDAISRDFAAAEFKKSSSIAVNLPSSRASVASSSVENLALTTSSRATLPLTSNGGNYENAGQPKESTASCM